MTARVGYSWNMDAILRDIDVGRAHAVAIHAASLVDHENRAAHIWFFFLFLCMCVVRSYNYSVPLGDPCGRRSSAIILCHDLSFKIDTCIMERVCQVLKTIISLKIHVKDYLLQFKLVNMLIVVIVKLNVCI